MMYQKVQQKNYDVYHMNMNQISDNNNNNNRKRIQNEFQESFLKHKGWIRVLDKYIRVQTDQESNEISVNIESFQEELVRKFSNFLVSTDEMFAYFISIKNQIIFLRDSQMYFEILKNLIRQLCSPTYYRECIDCAFFQQKCERKRKIIESNFDENIFKEFLDFLSEKRKQFSEQTTALKVEKISSIIEQACSMRKKSEESQHKKADLINFFDACKPHILFEDENGYLQPQNANRKNKIIISNEKNRISLVNEIIMKLAPFEHLYLHEIQIPSNDSNSLFKYEFIGNEINISGQFKSSKQKAKESCCDAHLFKTSESKSEQQQKYDIEEQKDCLTFSSEELYVANLKTLEPINFSQNDDSTSFGESSFNNLDDTNEILQKNNKEQTLNQKESNQDLGMTQILSQKAKKENENEYDQLISTINTIRDDLGEAAELELNPFTMIKRLFPDQNKKYFELIKKLKNLLSQIISCAVQLYDYESFVQSICVIVQENNNTFFLQTLIMKKKHKNLNLIGRVRTLKEEHTFISSAIELIYKFSFKHQSHQGDVKSLNQVLDGLIIEAEYLSKSYEENKLSCLKGKAQFIDKQQNQFNNFNGDIKDLFTISL